MDTQASYDPNQAPCPGGNCDYPPGSNGAPNYIVYDAPQQLQIAPMPEHGRYLGQANPPQQAAPSPIVCQCPAQQS